MEIQLRNILATLEKYVHFDFSLDLMKFTNNNTWVIETEFLQGGISQFFPQRIRHATFRKLFKSTFANK